MWVSTYCASTPLFSIVSYLWVFIALRRPPHSLLSVYTGKHLYDKNMNNEQDESISNQFCSVLYCTYGYLLYKNSVMNSYGRYENPIIRIILYENSVRRIRLYVNSDICIMIYVSCNCGTLQVVIYVICFPLSYKLSTGVSSV